MPLNLQIVIAIVGGLAVGALIVWLALRPRINHEYDRAKSESETERATLVERLQGKHDQTRKLEADLGELNSKVSEFQDENAGLLARISSLETQLEAERKASTEKLGLLEDAQGKLSDAFKALSADALNTNSQNFLRLARETLGHFQEGAKGDLDTRQKAIGELVQRVNARIGLFVAYGASEISRHNSDATAKRNRKPRQGASLPNRSWTMG